MENRPHPPHPTVVDANVIQMHKFCSPPKPFVMVVAVPTTLPQPSAILLQQLNAGFFLIDYISDNVPKAEAPAAINEQRKAAVFITIVSLSVSDLCGVRFWSV